MPEKTQKQMIAETHETVTTLKTVLLGVPNTADKGLVGQVKNNTKSIGKLKVIGGAIIGSGVLGGGGYGIAQLLGG